MASPSKGKFEKTIADFALGDIITFQVKCWLLMCSGGQLVRLNGAELHSPFLVSAEKDMTLTLTLGSGYEFAYIVATCTHP